MDFLSEAATFQCNQGASITFKDSSKAKFKGASLLTTGASLKMKIGICAILTAMSQGAPQPCKCQLTAWTAFDPTKTSSGNSLLTSQSKNFCSVGGVISVQQSGVFGHITN